MDVVAAGDIRVSQIHLVQSYTVDGLQTRRLAIYAVNMIFFLLLMNFDCHG